MTQNTAAASDSMTWPLVSLKRTKPWQLMTAGIILLILGVTLWLIIFSNINTGLAEPVNSTTFRYHETNLIPLYYALLPAPGLALIITSLVATASRQSFKAMLIIGLTYGYLTSMFLCPTIFVVGKETDAEKAFTSWLKEEQGLKPINQKAPVFPGSVRNNQPILLKTVNGQSVIVTFTTGSSILKIKKITNVEENN